MTQVNKKSNVTLALGVYSHVHKRPVLAQSATSLEEIFLDTDFATNISPHNFDWTFYSLSLNRTLYG